MDFPALVGKLDWVTKRALLEEAMRGSPHLGWESAELKYLDHFYSSLPDGLFFDLERDGLIHPLVTDAEIERFIHSPPEDTRAWGRSLLLRLGYTSYVSFLHGADFGCSLGSCAPLLRSLLFGHSHSPSCYFLAN